MNWANREDAAILKGNYLNTFSWQRRMEEDTDVKQERLPSEWVHFVEPVISLPWSKQFATLPSKLIQSMTSRLSFRDQNLGIKLSKRREIP